MYKPYPPHAPAYMYIETKEYTKRTIRSQAQLKTKKQIANHEGKIGHTYTRLSQAHLQTKKQITGAVKVR